MLPQSTHQAIVTVSTIASEPAWGPNVPIARKRVPTNSATKTGTTRIEIHQLATKNLDDFSVGLPAVHFDAHYSLASLQMKNRHRRGHISDETVIDVDPGISNIDRLGRFYVNLQVSHVCL
jgi:hypothetical protein